MIKLTEGALDSQRNFLSQKTELTITLDRAVSHHTIVDAQQLFQRYVEQLDYLAGRGEIDQDTVRACRYDIAQKALRLSQQVIPALTNLADEMMQAAGAEAVRTAVKPARFMNDDGTVRREQASGFVVPQEFQESTITAQITKAAKSTAAAVVATVIAAASTLRR